MLAAGVAWAQDKPVATGPAPGLVPLAVQLEQGIYQEETAGQLEAAAKTYGQIAAQAEATRLLAAQALYRLAVVQGKLKQTTEAQATVRRLAEEYPEQKDMIGKAVAAVPGASTQAVAAGSTGPTAQQKAQAAELVTKGWQLMQDGKFADAGDAFAKANRLWGGSTAALTGMGWADLQSNHSAEEPKRAGEYFKAALDIEPRNAAALNGLGKFYYQDRGDQRHGSENLVRALDAWKAAIEADPTATAPMAELASAQAHEGCYDEAISWYEKWLKVDPKSTSAKSDLERVRETQAAIKDGMAVVSEFLAKLDKQQFEDAFKLMEPPAPPQGMGNGGFVGGMGSFVGGTGGMGSFVGGMGGMGSMGGGPRGGRSVSPATTAASTAPPDPNDFPGFIRMQETIRTRRPALGKESNRALAKTSLSSTGGGGMGGNLGLIAVTHTDPTGYGDGIRLEDFAQITVRYTTAFAQQQQVGEVVTVFKNGSGQWRIGLYEFNPMYKFVVDPLKAQ